MWKDGRETVRNCPKHFRIWKLSKKKILDNLRVKEITAKCRFDQATLYLCRWHCSRGFAASSSKVVKLPSAPQIDDESFGSFPPPPSPQQRNQREAGSFPTLCYVDKVGAAADSIFTSNYREVSPFSFIASLSLSLSLSLWHNLMMTSARRWKMAEREPFFWMWRRKGKRGIARGWDGRERERENRQRLTAAAAFNGKLEQGGRKSLSRLMPHWQPEIHAPSADSFDNRRMPRCARTCNNLGFLSFIHWDMNHSRNGFLEVGTSFHRFIHKQAMT